MLTSIIRNRLALAATAALLAAAASAVLWRSGEQDIARTPAISASKLSFGGRFTLVDHSGKIVTDRDYDGLYKLIFFGFTNCPAVCPTTLQTVTIALEELGPAADRVKPLFITIDPEHDTPKVMAEYVGNFDRRIVGLTGTPQQIAAAAKLYHVHYKKVRDKDGSEQIEHTATLYLMAPDGALLAHIPPEASPRKMADLIRMEFGKAPGAQASKAQP